MANRFPLIVDSSTQRIKELPSTDNLDLSSSNISNVVGINATGNITANFFIGNGSQLTGISATSIANGNSNISIPTANGNVNISAGGTPNELVITSTGINVAGTINSTGTATVPNLVVSSNANITNTNLVKFGETVIAGGNTGATTLTPNAAAGTIYNYTLTGNITLSTLSNAVAGTSMTIILTQDNVGNRLLTSTMKFAGNIRTLSTTANTTDIMCVFFDGTTYYASLTKGYV